MRLVETISGMRGDKGEWVNSTIVNCKNFCKCHNVPPVQQ
jgi:hypothetical protein